MIVGDHRVCTLVEVFDDNAAARAAVLELKAVGFTDSQIQVLLQSEQRSTNEQRDSGESSNESDFSPAIIVGTAAEAVALCGQGVLARIPSEGCPIVGAGLQHVFTSTSSDSGSEWDEDRSCRAQNESLHRESQIGTGHTIVKVRAGTRADIACSVLSRFRKAEQFVAQVG